MSDKTDVDGLVEHGRDRSLFGKSGHSASALDDIDKMLGEPEAKDAPAPSRRGRRAAAKG